MIKAVTGQGRHLEEGFTSAIVNGANAIRKKLNDEPIAKKAHDEVRTVAFLASFFRPD